MMLASIEVENLGATARPLMKWLHSVEWNMEWSMESYLE
jgi:hypothetical protein